MAEKLESIFGDYASNASLQAIINRSLERFNKPWFTRRFRWGLQRNELTFATVLGASRIASLASIVDRDSTTPLRARQTLSKVNGEVPAIRHMRPLNESEMRAYLTLGDLATRNGGINPALDLIFNDIKFVGEGTEARIDDFVAQGLSKGYVEITTASNADGVTMGETIDLFLPAENKLVSSGNWQTANFDIIGEITTIVSDAQGRGLAFETILIDQLLWNIIRNNTKLQSFLSAFYNPGSNKTYAMTLENLNTAMTANGLPVFEIVNIAQMVEDDTKQRPYRPWKKENVTFVPAGELGVIHNAYAIEKLRPATGVNYADYNRTLISKWSTNEPVREFTKAELNAFPGFEAIEQIVILHTDGAAW